MFGDDDIWSGEGIYRRRMKTGTAMMMAISAMPPMTPPAMAPVLDEAEFIAAGEMLSVETELCCDTSDDGTLVTTSVPSSDVSTPTVNNRVIIMCRQLRDRLTNRGVVILYRACVKRLCFCSLLWC
jgi:hypothetical protein